MIESPCTRKSKSSPTMAALNALRAEWLFDRLVNVNFGEGDYLFTFTYDAQHIPEDFDEVEKTAVRLSRRISSLYKKRGVPLKYIRTTTCEAVSDDAPPEMLQFNIILSGGVDPEAIKALWITNLRPGIVGEKMGSVEYIELQPGEYGLSPLCDKLIQQPRDGVSRRWCSSLGLEKLIEA